MFKAEKAQFWDVKAWNYAQFEDDGTLKSLWNATTWDDLVWSLIARRLYTTTGRLNYNYDNNTITMQNGWDPTATADRLMFNFQYPHKGVQTNATEWTSAEQHMHIHREQVSSNKIERQLDYRIQRNWEEKETTWTSLTSNSDDDSAFTYVSWTLNQITNLWIITVPAPSLSATVEYRLTRTDTTTGDIEAVFVDAHIKYDTMGSREQFVK